MTKDEFTDLVGIEYADEYEKAQLSQEDATSSTCSTADTISRQFEEIVVEYPSFNNTYTEYKGKPYFSIRYKENGEGYIGYGTYKPEVLSQYLRDYFMPPAQPHLITEIQNGIKVTDADNAYSCGMRNGMRWCISLIDGKEPLYENCPAQPEPKWIPVNEELPDVGRHVLFSTTRGHVLAGYRLEPSSLYLVTDDEDGKEMWVYDPDSYSFLAVTSPNYDARFQGVTAWMPMPKPYKEVEEHGTD